MGHGGVYPLFQRRKMMAQVKPFVLANSNG